MLVFKIYVFYNVDSMYHCDGTKLSDDLDLNFNGLYWGHFVTPRVCKWMIQFSVSFDHVVLLYSKIVILYYYYKLCDMFLARYCRYTGAILAFLVLYWLDTGLSWSYNLPQRIYFTSHKILYCFRVYQAGGNHTTTLETTGKIKYQHLVFTLTIMVNYTYTSKIK